MCCCCWLSHSLQWCWKPLKPCYYGIWALIFLPNSIIFIGSFLLLLLQLLFSLLLWLLLFLDCCSTINYGPNGPRRLHFHLHFHIINARSKLNWNAWHTKRPKTRPKTRPTDSICCSCCWELIRADNSSSTTTTTTATTDIINNVHLRRTIPSWLRCTLKYQFGTKRYFNWIFCQQPKITKKNKNNNNKQQQKKMQSRNKTKRKLKVLNEENINNISKW